MTAAEPVAVPLSLPCEHGLLHGRLMQVAAAAGLVILVHDGSAESARDEALASHFRLTGMSTLSIDLLAWQEAQFSDAHFNVSLLARRLLDFLDLIKKRMLIGELPTQPLGLWAADATSPVALRVAALRDQDIAALVCQGGLIDLAGMLYLRSLASPLLLLVGETEPLTIASNTRAMQEVRCRKELKLMPESGVGVDCPGSPGQENASAQAANWFIEHFQGAGASANAGERTPV